MTVSATLEVFQSSMRSGQAAQFGLVLSNDGADPVDLVAARPLIVGSAPALLGEIPPQAGDQIPAGGSISRAFAGEFLAGVQPDGFPEQSSAQVAVAVTTATAAGVLSNTSSNIVTMQVMPVTQPEIVMPVDGQLRFDSNRLSALFPAVL